MQPDSFENDWGSRFAAYRDCSRDVIAFWKLWSRPDDIGCCYPIPIEHHKRNLHWAMLPWLEDHYGMSKTVANRDQPPLITVQVGKALIPADTSERWILFSRFIPEMRQAITAQFGLPAPGVRIQGIPDIAAACDYRILLHGTSIPVATGTIEVGWLFVNASPERIGGGSARRSHQACRGSANSGTVCLGQPSVRQISAGRWHRVL